MHIQAHSNVKESDGCMSKLCSDEKSGFGWMSVNRFIKKWNHGHTSVPCPGKSKALEVSFYGFCFFLPACCNCKRTSLLWNLHRFFTPVMKGGYYRFNGHSNGRANRIKSLCFMKINYLKPGIIVARFWSCGGCF